MKEKDFYFGVGFIVGLIGGIIIKKAIFPSKENLEEKLKKAVEEERYEDAAVLRDQIKNYKQ